MERGTTTELNRDRLRAAGLAAEELRQGEISCARRTFLAGPIERADADKWYDGIIASAFSDELATLGQQLLSGRPNYFVERSREGIVVHDAFAPRATIIGSHAILGSGQRIAGNFLVDGFHWKRFLGLLGAGRRRLTTRTVDPRFDLITEFPESLKGQLLQDAIGASRQLRQERAVVFGQTISVVGTNETLRFEPLARRAGVLELPFTWRGAGGAITARILLSGDTDPLALSISSSVRLDVGRPWALGLIAYALLSCLPVTARPASGGLGANREPMNTSETVGWRVLPKTAARRQRLPLHECFEPIGQTEYFLSHYVVGHRRRLSPGKRATGAAKQAAAELGIRLSKHETWVRPHSRGIPADVELEFRWTQAI